MLEVSVIIATTSSSRLSLCQTVLIFGVSHIVEECAWVATICLSKKRRGFKILQKIVNCYTDKYEGTIRIENKNYEIYYN